MTNAELLAKIKTEIENAIHMLGPGYSEMEMGQISAYGHILSFLSTFESEKPINPDDAMKELDEKIALVKRNGTWDGVDVDKYMDEVRGREPEKPNNHLEGLDDAAKNYALNTAEDSEQYSARYLGYKDGAKWQNEQSDKELSEKIAASYQLGRKDEKEQMMKEARNHFVHNVLSGNDMKKMIEIYNDEVNCKPGNVVRVIIFKKEDEK